MKKDLTIEKYKDNYLLRSLINLFSICGVSVGSAIDVFLDGKIQEMRKRRIEAFFDELSKGKIKLSEEVVKSNDFIHRFIITLKAVVNERREQKIKYLARLLKNHPLEIGNEELNDEYELLLNILEETEFRELEILVILYEYENKFPPEEEENRLKRVSKFWDKFKNEICKKYDISESEFDGYISRISNTGLFKEITGSFCDYTGSKGYLTGLFTKLVKYIGVEQKNY